MLIYHIACRLRQTLARKPALAGAYIISQTSTTNRFTEMFSFPARHLYACPNVWLGQKLVELDVAPPTFMRAPGETTGTFALESAIDELAY